MRLFLAIVVCKVLRFVGGLMGKGSSLPGQYALKLCPDVLGRVRLPAHIIAVTGSNGKTSTVEMIAEILKQDGRKVVYNKEGSNQIEGVATLILSSCSLGGRVRGDVLLLESDERYAKLTFRWFHPTHFIITNLYRDQLTRNGHPEWVYDAIKPAIFPETTLILNADDPLVSCFARDHDPARVKWFGLDQGPVSTREHRGVYHDGARCPVCRGRMEYACYHYAHIGHYACPACGHRRHSADFAVTALDLKAGRLTINGETDISLAFKSIYNVYNILAAWSACAVAGVSPAVMAGVIDNYLLKNGRMITFRLGQHRGTLLTSKHENSVAYDTNLAYIADSGKPCAVLVLVDSISRKYFTGETSWLWDIDFDRLNVPHVEKILLYGKYCNDLAVRFKYSQIPADRVQMGEDVGEGLALLRESGNEDIYAVTCFSDRDKLLACVDRD